MNILIPNYRIMRLEKQDYCDLCKQKIENNLEQEVGYHANCLQILPAEVQKLHLLKEKIIELTGVSRVYGKIILLDFEVQDHAIVKIFIDSDFLTSQSKNLKLLQEMVTLFPGLKTLIIDGLSNIPTFLKDMDKLKILRLSIESDIGNPANMDVLRKIKSLKILNLAFNELRTLPEELFDLTTLTKLDLSNNELVNLSGSISKLVNLEELNISDNGLRKIPESIGKLKKLKRLDISRMVDWNEHWELFKTLPESIGELENLEVLNVSDNVELTSLPESIGKLQKLKELYLDGNENLKDLPTTIYQLKALEILQLDNIGLVKLSEEIGKLKKLKILHLNNNKLERLPESIGELQDLQELQIGGNNLSNLPESVSKIPRNWIE